jgi:hypothetical protein
MHEQREMHTEFWSEDIKKRDTMGDLGVDIKFDLEEM